MRIIYKEQYKSYENALNLSKLTTLDKRREKLLLNFAKKCIKNEKTVNMFPRNEIKNTRQKEVYKVPFAFTERYKNSAIPAMARMLNTQEQGAKY